MTSETNSSGTIEISPHAIATVASQAVLQSYGVVGMASKNVVDGLANIIAPDPRHGVEVLVHNGVITINLYLVIEYGTRISEVAHSAARLVRYRVESALGMPIGDVNVYVQGLRVSDPDA